MNTVGITWVQYLAQGYFGIETGAARDQAFQSVVELYEFYELLGGGYGLGRMWNTMHDAWVCMCNCVCFRVSECA